MQADSKTINHPYQTSFIVPNSNAQLYAMILTSSIEFSHLLFGIISSICSLILNLAIWSNIYLSYRLQCLQELYRDFRNPTTIRWKKNHLTDSVTIYQFWFLWSSLVLFCFSSSAFHSYSEYVEQTTSEHPIADQFTVDQLHASIRFQIKYNIVAVWIYCDTGPWKIFTLYQK